MEGGLTVGHKPIRLNPIFKERVWGGTELSKFGYSLPSEYIGEAWLFCDHKEGKNIPSLDLSYMGEKALSSKTGRSNILIKLLNAREDLSIQVHPSNDYIKLDKDELGKAEVWYILSAEKDAKIVYGLKNTCSIESLTDAIENDKILLELNEIPVESGDIVYIPPGTVHALCKGLVVIEIQQNSDTTFRLFDYNRLGLDGKPRDLHIEQSLEVIDFNQKNLKIKKSKVDPATGWGLVESNSFFIAEEAVVLDRLNISSIKDCFTFFFCVDGKGLLVWEDEEFSVKTGDCFIIPASNKSYSFIVESKSHIIRSYIK